MIYGAKRPYSSLFNKNTMEYIIAAIVIGIIIMVITNEDNPPNDPTLFKPGELTKHQKKD